MTRNLLATANLQLNLWVEAALTFIYLINILPTPLLKWQSPFSIIFQCSPSYSHLQTFGCSCFPHLRAYVSNKLISRSLECVFLGYSLQHKSYQCLDPTSGKVYIS